MLARSMILRHNGTVVPIDGYGVPNTQSLAFLTGIVKEKDWLLFSPDSTRNVCIPVNNYVINLLSGIDEIKFVFDDYPITDDDIPSTRWQEFKNRKGAESDDELCYEDYEDYHERTYEQSVTVCESLCRAGKNIIGLDDTLYAFLLYCQYEGIAGHLPYDRDRQFRLPAILRVEIDGKESDLFRNLREYIEATFYGDYTSILINKRHGQYTWVKTSTWKQDKKTVMVIEQNYDCRPLSIKVRAKDAKLLHKLTMVDLHIGVIKTRRNDAHIVRNWGQEEWFTQYSDYTSIITLLLSANYLASAYIKSLDIVNLKAADNNIVAQLQCQYVSKKAEGSVETPVYTIPIRATMPNNFIEAAITMIRANKHRGDLFV